MKNILPIVLSLLFTFSIVGCKDKAEEANTGDAEAAAVSKNTSDKFTVSTSESSIEWKGFKPTGSHNGTISLESGVLKTEDGKLQSGTFLIDMKSITVTDLESGDGKEDLEAHLKGTVEGKEDHFFDVSKFPTAAFEITSTDPSDDGYTKLSGNLTIKEQKHNISFPITITNENDQMTIKSEPFTIDRTKWNVNYGSKSIFDNLGDRFINDDIQLQINIKAKKS
ncbi:YceI family protein [Psychroserpens sp.]|uniref:YceI family protein n=1 Tax=Psychroserpens sp. TaxID=2020870 RepID=UPI00385A6452